MDGSVDIIESLENSVATALDWAISPDGKRLLYLDESYKFIILDRESNLITLPAFLDKEAFQFFRLDPFKRGIRWNHDGSQVLVFAYESSQELCPDDISIVSGNYFEQPCWLLIDPFSGEIVWSLKESVIEQFSQWEGLFLYFEATFSPDNQWIVMSVMNSSSREFIAISPKTDEFIILGNFVAANVEWGD
jgi:hypothetical protein